MKAEDVSSFLWPFFSSENINWNIHFFFIHIQFWTCWSVRTCLKEGRGALPFQKAWSPAEIVLQLFISLLHTLAKSNFRSWRTLKPEERTSWANTYKRLEEISVCISNSNIQLVPSPWNITPNSVASQAAQRSRICLPKQKMQEMAVWSLGHKDPLEKATHSSILAWEIPRQRSLVGCSPVVTKELDTT